MTASVEHPPTDFAEKAHIMRDHSAFSLDTSSLDTHLATTSEPHRSADFDHEHVVARRPASGESCSLAEATLDQETPFTEAEVACLMQQVLSGLEFLHSKDACHGNLRLSNLIIDGLSGNIKVLAEDLSVHLKPKSGKKHLLDAHAAASGCCSFQSPELRSDGKRSKASDVWSIGGITLELLIRGSAQEHAQNLSRRPALQDAAAGVQPMYPLGLSMECISFLEDCFQVDPNERASAAELFDHPFIVDGCAQHESDDLDSQLCSAIDHALVISEALRTQRPHCRPSAVAALPSKGKAQFLAPSHTERECAHGPCEQCGAVQCSGWPRRLSTPIVAAQKTVSRGLVLEDGAKSPASAATTKRRAAVALEEVPQKMEKRSKRLCNQWLSEELEMGNDLSLLGFAT